MKQHIKLGLAVFLMPLACCFSCTQYTHEHTYSEKYKYDETYHWQESNCEHTGFAKNLGEHSYVDGECSICGAIDPSYVYDEPEDDLQGEDPDDITHLKQAISYMGNNYTINNSSHFTPSALELYKSHYGNDFSLLSTRMISNKFCYTYSNIEEYKALPEYNKIYLDVNGVRKYAIADRDLTTATTFIPNLRDDDGLYPFTLSQIDDSYFELHQFKRVSKFKYSCNEDIVINSKGQITHPSVISDFLDLCAPYLKNNGNYMTYNRVTIELNAYDQITRIRIYASSTQASKLTNKYLNSEHTHWYLLFNETTFTNIGNTKLKCLDNYF